MCTSGEARINAFVFEPTFKENTMNDIDKILLKCNLTIDLTNNIIAWMCGNLIFLHWMKNHRNIFLDFKSYDCFDAKINGFSNFENHIYDLENNCSDITELLVAVSIVIFFLIVVYWGHISVKI